jgi:hypothetical protein
VQSAPNGTWRDAENLLIEQFGLFDNLMIEAGILASAVLLWSRRSPWNTVDRPSVFERCVRLAASG